MSPPINAALGEMLTARLRLAAAIAGAPIAVLYRLDGQRATLIGAHCERDLLSFVPRDAPSWRLTRREAVAIPVVGRGPAAPEAVLFPIEFCAAAIVSAPVMRGDTQIGSLVMVDRESREDLVRLDMSALATMCELLAELVMPAAMPPAGLRPESKRPSYDALPAAMEELAAWPLADGAHDPVTGLPDRLMLASPIANALDTSREGHGVGIALLALDRFQRIDDWLGRQVGDEILRQVAERLLENSTDVDLVGRGSGDEFLIAFTELRGGRSAPALVDRMLQSLHEPFHVQGYELSLSATVGISRFPEDAKDVPTLLRYAGIALHRAKTARQRGRVEMFTHDLRQAVEQRGDLERHLRHALGADELLLHYQPKVDLVTRKMRSVEALIRWRRGDELVSPGAFLPVAEESELIVPIGTWVMRESCRQMQRWRAQGLALDSVSVNVSALQFARPDFVGTVERVLRASSMPPSFLELEVTETSIMDDVSSAAAKLAQLRELGVKVSVDDFGTGYSSLAYLQRLPVDVLKIDRSFVMDLDASERTARSHAHALAEAITGLGHSLGLKVLAEGVETEAQLEAVAGLGCDEVQGFYFSKPVPPEDIEAVIA